MKVHIRYFASLRESVGRAGEEIEFAGDQLSVSGLREHLAAHGVDVLGQTATLRAAVNQVMAGPETAVGDGDEVAFFPPVTGG
ncbi:MAG: molybdopterin converting factor subunit 1 [Zoogloeaceae bacterium]|nr:molybdopterin converting factor subunit 1 [Rhodocyclaceae bacterium]MCP5234499.1 molybdopterin converting factor subunit 1 [Zoogloeaceae bacterium]